MSAGVWLGAAVAGKQHNLVTAACLQRQTILMLETYDSTGCSKPACCILEGP